jgi:N-acetyl-anhydromuramyl-L-alanine amidase AmpD
MELKIIDKKINNVFQTNKKSKVILTHTARNVDEYLQSIRNRKNGKYDKIPHYIITRNGQILRTLNDNECPNYLTDNNLNKDSIIISFENLGWLEKEPLKNSYINWIGNIYKGEVFQRRWRDYIFWQPYSKEQLESGIELIKMVCKTNEIQQNFVGHNTKINRVEKIEGIITRSNLNVRFTDVSPAFDFELYSEKLNNE